MNEVDWQVAIIGGGPSGLLLSQLLNRAGISTVILERSTREHVLRRTRAGVLEPGTVDLLRAAGASDRMDREGLLHDGCKFSADGRMFRIDFRQTCGKQVMVCGQTEVTRDLYDAQDALGATILHEVKDVALHDLTTGTPQVTCKWHGQSLRITCDYVAGCDGFHGVSRQSITSHLCRVYEKVYPFGWLGVLSRTPPADEELIYASSGRGFALASMRNALLSHYYLQVPLTDRVEDWTDVAFWAELKCRLPADVAERLVTGPSIEKSIAPLRSFVSEPMRWGRLFLCGDSARIVPPTGAKGLNLAAWDVHYLSSALLDWYRTGDAGGLDAYSDRALARVWKAMRFAWSMTMTLHRFPDHSDYEVKLQATELANLERSSSAQTLLAENDTGLPY